MKGCQSASVELGLITGLLWERVCQLSRYQPDFWIMDHDSEIETSQSPAFVGGFQLENPRVIKGFQANMATNVEVVVTSWGYWKPEQLLSQSHTTYWKHLFRDAFAVLPPGFRGLFSPGPFCARGKDSGGFGAFRCFCLHHLNRGSSERSWDSWVDHSVTCSRSVCFKWSM